MPHILLSNAIITLLFVLFITTATAATIQLPQTGQTACYDASGNVIVCANTGQDGDKRVGVPSPAPRFTDNANGTVTDNLTGLIWLKNANCTDTVGGVAKGSGSLTWPNALTWSNVLATGSCSLSDGSVAGDWRLPNITELESLVDLSQRSPALPFGHPFSSVLVSTYWSSSTSALVTNGAFFVDMGNGSADVYGNSKTISNYVWPVRGGQ